MTPELVHRVEMLDDRRRQALARLLLSESAELANERLRLCAYLVPAAGATIDQTEINAWLRTRLPEYMMPDAITSLDSLPRLPNGKANPAELPAPAQSAVEDQGIVAPRNETERILADIWSQLLGLDVVSIHDDFFEVGGDSIVSIQVMSRARQAGILLQPADFAANNTIAELATVATQIEDVDTVLSDNDTTPQVAKYVFRLDGLGNTIQYYGVHDSGDEPTLGAAQTARLDRTYKREPRLEEMAADYLAVVRGLQPDGPYMFVSMRCAVHVTYEVAQQLIRAGQDVSFFGVVESDPPVQAGSVVAKYIRKGFRYLRRMDLSGLVAGLKLTWARGVAVKPRQTVSGKTLPFNHGLTINGYLPQKFPRKITIFQSTEYQQNHGGEENVRQWAMLADAGTEVVIVDGNYPLDLVAKEHSRHIMIRLQPSTDCTITLPREPSRDERHLQRQATSTLSD